MNELQHLNGKIRIIRNSQILDFKNGLPITDSINPMFGLIKKSWGFQGFVDLDIIFDKNDKKSLPSYPFPTKENPNQNIYPRLGFALIDNSDGKEEISQNNHRHRFYSELVFVYVEGDVKLVIEEDINKIENGWYAFYVPEGLYHDIIASPGSVVVTCDIKSFNLKDRESRPQANTILNVNNTVSSERIINLQLEEKIKYEDPIFNLPFLITTIKDSIDPKRYILIEVNPNNFINGKKQIPKDMITDKLESSQGMIDYIRNFFQKDGNGNGQILYIGIPKPIDIFDLLKNE
jgi:hypothetical protein